MRERISPRPVLNAALATLGLTALHHVYGGLIFGTPWRVHGAAIAIVVGAALIALATVYVRTHKQLAGYALAAAVIAMPVLATGLFEGGYNHLVKNVLFFAGAPHEVLVALFPPPTYEMPSEVFFELTGIAQMIPAAIAALASVRFIRELRHGHRCHRAICNETLRLRCVTSIDHEPVEIPDPTRLVHLQFRRFAGCPVCNLHLRVFVRRHVELEAAGIREVVVFHSAVEELRAHVQGLPFAVIADPDRRVYREFGVGSSRRALLDPRAWGTILIAVVRSTIAVLRGRERLPSLNPYGGRLGLPADFLIDSRGRVIACKHGEHADDQWTLDDVLQLVRAPAANPSLAVTSG
jgi:peroxiredoxin